MRVTEDAQIIMKAALDAALPDTAVKKALTELPLYRGRLILVAIGKAAWQMASAAWHVLGERVDLSLIHI